MIKVTIYKDKDNLITGFKVLGHAGYGQEGNDVVCAAVSALVINTINSIEYFTSDTFDYSEDEKSGLIEFHLTSPISKNGNLLLSSLAYGLHGIKKECKGKYISISERVSQKNK
ncbi:ribosomal-processing cysteine protease Prp [Herbinix luporum]|jgi:uncharacterized protein YsxB (DUF464 family)|uniref:Ribosomal processing cysteine protease Prp n=1 Tax=Herbinix luporum TaxID=1679721 RepID=A0A0K8J582_9FIRM|nr:ribosomal-processing cysteine protease Prp [Herbinix luporum]MDI9489144.1 ribosomal-processing cysteine protease Prp [Bacillota bacterium]CUH92498.1 hypothetical protein SD1D_0951 [Herbinix luporum]HHT57099.1 ribosomal-processing cysteine protease Prp [Herbinix luporum]